MVRILHRCLWFPGTWLDRNCRISPVQTGYEDDDDRDDDNDNCHNFLTQTESTWEMDVYYYYFFLKHNKLRRNWMAPGLKPVLWTRILSCTNWFCISQEQGKDTLHSINHGKRKSRKPGWTSRVREWNILINVRVQCKNILKPAFMLNIHIYIKIY